jgi:hypothetical protein
MFYIERKLIMFTILVFSDSFVITLVKMDL